MASSFPRYGPIFKLSDCFSSVINISLFLCAKKINIVVKKVNEATMKHLIYEASI